MSTPPSSPEKPQPRPVYSTPAKSTVEVLEEMVSKPPSESSSCSSSRTTLSPSNSIRTPSTSQTSHSKPLPSISRPQTPLHDMNTPRATSKPLPIPVDEPKLPLNPSTASQSQSTFSLVSRPESASPSSPSRRSSHSLPRNNTKPDAAQKETRHRRHHSDPAAASSSAPDAHAQANKHHNRRRSAGSSHLASSSISAVMALTAERLTRETARADAAERQAAEVLAMFKSTHEAKLRLERDMQRVKDELGLYKIQLDKAQKEIFRAQDVVDQVDRKRVEAEEELSRMKERYRRLSKEMAVEHAMEEGRRLGFEEGLRQGRMFDASLDMELEPWDDFNEREPAPPRKPMKSRDTRDEDDLDSRVTRQVYPKTNSEGSPQTKSTKLEPKRSQHATAAPSAPRTESELTQSVYPQVSTYAPNPKPKPPHHTEPKPEHHHHHHHEHHTGLSAYASHYGPESTPDVAKYPQPLPIPTVTTPAPMRVPSTQPPVPAAMPPHSHRHPSVMTMASNTSDPEAPESIKVRPSNDGTIHPVPVHNGSAYGHEKITVPPDGYIPTVGKNDMISLPPPHELSYPVAAEGPPPPPPPPAPVVNEVVQPPRPKSGGSRPDSRMRGGSSYAPSTSTSARPPRTAESESVPYSGRPSMRETESLQQRSTTNVPPRPLYDRPLSAASMRTTNNTNANAHSTGNGGAGRRATREVTLPMPLGDPFDDPTTANAGSTNYGTGSRSATPAEGLYGRPRSATPAEGMYGRPRTPIPVERMFARPRSATPVEGVFNRPRSATPAEGAYGRPRSVTPGENQYGRPLYMNSNSSFEPTPEKRSSTATLPAIQVETPSTNTHSAPNSNRNTLVDPVLLTPESANRPISLPEQQQQQYTIPTNSALGISTGPDGEERIEMTLPDNNFPPGFVPLSPIPGMENLNPYPVGYAPPLPKAPPSPAGSSGSHVHKSPDVRPVRPRV